MTLTLALQCNAEAGRLLAEKKASLKHGNWLPWLARNADALGFNSDRTAQRLIRLATENPTLASDLVLDAKNVTQRLWGHKTPEAGEVPFSFEWYSDPLYPDMTRHVFGDEIDLDAASCQEANDKYVRALKFYTKEQDGTKLPWNGKVYVNPPWQAMYMEPFVDKLLEERANGNCTEAILVSGGFTNIAWFHKLLANDAAICLARGRIPFFAPGNDQPSVPPNFGIAFSYFGRKHKKFAKVFGEVGTIIKAA